MTESTFRTITTDEFEELVVSLYQQFLDTGVRHALLGEGPPGIGKTSTMLRVAKRCAAMHDLDLAEWIVDPGDHQFGYMNTQMANSPEEVISGLPWADKETHTQQRAFNRDYPRTGRGIWHLDEPLQAGYTQRFVAQIITDGGIGSHYRLPDGWFPVLTGNSAKDRSGVQRMWRHFQNRVMLVRIHPTVEGALRNFRHPATPEVSVYLRWFNEALYQFDASKDGPFPTPRTWDYVNSLITGGSTPDDGFVQIQGYLGEGVARDFRTCYEAVAKLPNIDDMLADPEGHRDWIRSTQQNNPSTMAAVAFVLLRQVDQDRNVKIGGKGIKLFEQAGLEHVASYLAVAEEIDKKHDDGRRVLDTPEYAQLVVRHQDIIAN